MEQQKLLSKAAVIFGLMPALQVSLIMASAGRDENITRVSAHAKPPPLAERATASLAEALAKAERALYFDTGARRRSSSKKLKTNTTLSARAVVCGSDRDANATRLPSGCSA